VLPLLAFTSDCAMPVSCYTRAVAEMHCHVPSRMMMNSLMQTGQHMRRRLAGWALSLVDNSQTTSLFSTERYVWAD